MNRRSATDRGARMWVAVELITVFVVAPMLIYVDRVRFGRLIIPALLAIAGCCLFVLLRDPRFDRARLGRSGGLGHALRRPLVVFAIAGGLLAIVVAVLLPDLFLDLPRRRPVLWLAVLVLYPVLSVYPQELIFRTYLFHRSRGLLRRPWIRVIASALAFGLAHLFFANWIAPVMCTLGGLLFAATYARTGSTLAACIEHALWGDLVFTIGLGRYFYGGSIT